MGFKSRKRRGGNREHKPAAAKPAKEWLRGQPIETENTAFQYYYKVSPTNLRWTA